MDINLPRGPASSLDVRAGETGELVVDGKVGAIVLKMPKRRFCFTSRLADYISALSGSGMPFGTSRTAHSPVYPVPRVSNEKSHLLRGGFRMTWKTLYQLLLAEWSFGVIR
jgi:hypothetical protein